MHHNKQSIEDYVYNINRIEKATYKKTDFLTTRKDTKRAKMERQRNRAVFVRVVCADIHQHEGKKKKEGWVVLMLRNSARCGATCVSPSFRLLPTVFLLLL
jgi:hypothetical protein